MSRELNLRLHRYLLEHGLLDAGELSIAEKVSCKRGESLARSLLRMELIEAAELSTHFVEALGYPMLDIDKCVVDQNLVSFLGQEICSHHRVIPVTNPQYPETVDLVFSDPANIVSVDALRQRLGSRRVRICMADDQDIARALHRCFDGLNGGLADSSQSDAVMQLSEVLSQAIALSASDIHLEPTGDCARLRFRCDGVLRLWRHIELQQWQLLVNRIKVLAALDIADSRSPQDGHFSHVTDGLEVDIRVSVMPTDSGEAIVLRLLDRNRHALSFDSLGVVAEQQATLQALLRKPEGLLLVCGPTGSGKSTTLYALVESIRGESLNILTLEDPVEYPATWVRQSSINDAISMDYADGVRAALRQDPDVMLIGEMRDSDTAQMALRAAMTGHRVLTTVHANSALASVTRLCDLGLESSLLAGNLMGVVAQRLLRKLCEQCKVVDTDRLDAFKAVGCEQCRGMGYNGRLPILEIWQLDGDFDELLHQGASRRAFEKLAEQKGMSGLREAALTLLSKGLTSAQEVERVVGPIDLVVAQ